MTSGPSDDAAIRTPSADGSLLSGGVAGNEENRSPLFRRGVEALRANEGAAAIELLRRAVALDASDPQPQFQLGVALQAAGRHADALSRFRMVNQRIGFLRFAAAIDLQGVWHGGEVSGFGE